jgi:hypothetical protein
MSAEIQIDSNRCDKHKVANICANFRKFEMVLMGYSGDWGELIHEKNLETKILCQTSFNTV